MLPLQLTCCLADLANLSTMRRMEVLDYDSADRERLLYNVKICEAYYLRVSNPMYSLVRTSIWKTKFKHYIRNVLIISLLKAFIKICFFNVLCIMNWTVLMPTCSALSKPWSSMVNIQLSVYSKLTLCSCTGTNPSPYLAFVNICICIQAHIYKSMPLVTCCCFDSTCFQKSATL